MVFFIKTEDLDEFTILNNNTGIAIYMCVFSIATYILYNYSKIF